MDKNVILIYQKSRENTAVKVQEVLTGFGCFIKTRLGIHDSESNCSPRGLIILEMAGDKDQAANCKAKLEEINDVTVELVTMKLPE